MIRNAKEKLEFIKKFESLSKNYLNAKTENIEETKRININEISVFKETDNIKEKPIINKYKDYKYRVIWSCDKCNTQEIIYYTEEDFKTIEQIYEFGQSSKHYCKKCKSFSKYITDVQEL